MDALRHQLVKIVMHGGLGTPEYQEVCREIVQMLRAAGIRPADEVASEAARGPRNWSQGGKQAISEAIRKRAAQRRMLWTR